MFYLLFLSLGCLAFYSIEKQGLSEPNSVYLFALLPFIGLWIFMVGGQYEVGTDYQSYLSFFNGKRDVDYFAAKGEYCFSTIVDFFQSIGIYGQFYFYFFAAISVLLYLQIAREVTFTHYALFFFLFMTVSTLFHTQMNGLRQCMAVYFSTLSFILFICGRRIVPLGLMFVAVGFHISAMALLPLFFLTKLSFSTNIARVCIVVAAILSFASFDSLLEQVILSIPQYEYYAESEYFQSDISLLNKLTKLAYLPIYLLSLSVIKGGKISGIEMRLFQFGLLAYLLKTVSIVSSVTNRFGYYFMILSMLPIFYYLRSIQKEKRILFIVICAYILIMYAVKVVLFPTREYLYDSILRTYF